MNFLGIVILAVCERSSIERSVGYVSWCIRDDCIESIPMIQSRRALSPSPRALTSSWSYELRATSLSSSEVSESVMSSLQSWSTAVLNRHEKWDKSNGNSYSLMLQLFFSFIHLLIAFHQCIKWMQLFNIITKQFRNKNNY